MGVPDYVNLATYTCDIFRHDELVMLPVTLQAAIIDPHAGERR
jgi:hypothetical protein